MIIHPKDAKDAKILITPCGLALRKDGRGRLFVAKSMVFASGEKREITCQ